jgi:hypothetical protein
VCGYPGLDESPYDYANPTYEICPCCGIEFGYEDSAPTPEEWPARCKELRDKWIKDGANWWAAVAGEEPPDGWDPIEQMRKAGLK